MNNIIQTIKNTWLIISLISISACERELDVVSFYDKEDISISEYIKSQGSTYSNFLKVIELGNLERTLTARNPLGAEYTLFLPTNDAFDRFIEKNNNYNAFQELLNDVDYINQLGRYHIVNIALNSNDFPFGALPDTTLSGDLLTMGFKIESDTTVYIINNIAPIILPNIKLTNGYIHVISEVLPPIVFNSYEWLKEQGGYSIMTQAMEETGIKDTFAVEIKNGKSRPLQNTVFVESDEVFYNEGIYSLNDLKLIVSDSNNYTDYSNGLYQFVAYHILDEHYFLNDLEGQSTNFNTYGSLPIFVNATGLDIKINTGVANFDTVISSYDTTIINFITLDYDKSNVITKNGAIHFINNVMYLYKPPRSNRYFEFYEDPVIKRASKMPREHLFDEPEDFTKIRWEGQEYIYYLKSSADILGCSNGDYISISGDFIIYYEIPKILPGNYVLRINADSRGENNATIQVYLDGKKVGRNIDLTSGAISGDFGEHLIGHVVFSNYEKHEIRIQPLINGTFIWDYVAFIRE